ncbi:MULTISPECIES: hypothetical protein [unclassified Psychrobacillus]|uniref:hypothetical protein n=1 Tax=unclassified Psychrobacillus TaxID=2636677 RepID=UPI0030F5A2CD
MTIEKILALHGVKRMPRVMLENVRSVEEYWLTKAEEGKALEVLEKPCSDCAVTCNFYTPMCDELLEQPLNVQNGALERWFCHNHLDKACRGAKNYVEMKRKKAVTNDV